VNLKLFVALLSAGIAALVGSTAFVASLPASPRTSGAVHRSVQTTTISDPHAGGTLPRGWTASPPGTRATPTSAAGSTQQTSSPTTAFVLVTISYGVKKGDTVASIEHWFDQRGYGTQFAANMQVIEDNTNLLVPGAVVSISNGVMTIHSPV